MEDIAAVGARDLDRIREPCRVTAPDVSRCLASRKVVRHGPAPTEEGMARNTLPSTAYECVGGPFDGDTVACGEGRCVEVSWGGECQGHYILTAASGSLMLRWVPFEE